MRVSGDRLQVSLLILSELIDTYLTFFLIIRHTQKSLRLTL